MNAQQAINKTLMARATSLQQAGNKRKNPLTELVTEIRGNDEKD